MPQGNQPDHSDSKDIQAASRALRAMTQELRNVQQTVIVQLAQDIARLQAEKARLTDDVDRLMVQQQHLQAQELEGLSRRQIAQQQQWAKRLAEALAAHLESAILQRLEEWGQPRNAQATKPSNGAVTNGAGHSNPDQDVSEKAHLLLASLDNTFTTTFRSLQQELDTYQSSLSQQLGRMHGMEQQGEAILDALLTRLREQLDSEARKQADLERIRAQQQVNADFPAEMPRSSLSEFPLSSPSFSVSLPPTSPPTRSPEKPSGMPTLTQGIWFMVVSTLALSVHNVIVSIIGFGGKFLGVEAWQVGPYINLVIGNSLLILLLRMLVVVPCLALLAPQLYPKIWHDLERFFKLRDKKPLLIVLGSGACLFISQVSVYIAIAKIGPGVAVTILFMYPVITVPLAWWILGDRPTSLRWGVMVAVAIGVILTALPRLSLKTGSSMVDIGIAIISGIAFACYLISMQVSFKKLHPVPVSMLQFTTILFLSATSLWLPLPSEYKLQVSQSNWSGILIGSLVLGALTLVGYLSNNLGMKILGPAQGSIFSSAGPVMTALLAFLLTPSVQSRLGIVQFIGIMVVTLAVTVLSQEKQLMGTKAKARN